MTARKRISAHTLAPLAALAVLAACGGGDDVVPEPNVGLPAVDITDDYPPCSELLVPGGTVPANGDITCMGDEVLEIGGTATYACGARYAAPEREYVTDGQTHWWYADDRVIHDDMDLELSLEFVDRVCGPLAEPAD